MTTGRRVVMLLVAAIVVIVLGIWLSSRKVQIADTAAGTPVMKALKAQLNDVTEVRISKGDGSRTTLRKQPAGWIVGEREYPADTTRVRKLLIEKQILSDPSVVVQVKEYNSRRVTVMGQVAKPGTFPYTTGLTLIQAISQAGGVTGIANLDKVNLTRRTGSGSRTVVISIGSIMEGRSADIPLQSGDRIFVHERIF